MARKHNVGLQFGDTSESSIEVVDFKPQQYAVAVGLVSRIPDRAVVVCDLKTVQLEDEAAFGDQSLVLRPAVRTLTAKEVLIPLAACLDVGDRNEGLRTHATSAAKLLNYLVSAAGTQREDQAPSGLTDGKSAAGDHLPPTQMNGPAVWALRSGASARNAGRPGLSAACGLNGARDRRRRQVRQLHHERCQAGITALTVNFPTTNERSPPDTERPLHAIGPTDPTAACDNEKELSEPSLVRPDRAARLDANTVNVAFPAPFTEWERVGPVASVH
jgi:hypothetical protein